MRRATRLLFFLGLALWGCGGDAPFFAPSVVLQLALPAELHPSRVDCLDIVLRSATHAPPPLSIGFGGDPLLVRVQTLDLDGDGRLETRVRLVEGTRPFACAPSTALLLTRQAAGGEGASFELAVVARRADGAVDPADRCLGGSALVSGSATADKTGQPIRFPARGDALVELPLSCASAGGCALPASAGACAAVTP